MQIVIGNISKFKPFESIWFDLIHVCFFLLLNQKSLEFIYMQIAMGFSGLKITTRTVFSSLLKRHLFKSIFSSFDV